MFCRKHSVEREILYHGKAECYYHCHIRLECTIDMDWWPPHYTKLCIALETHGSELHWRLRCKTQAMSEVQGIGECMRNSSDIEKRREENRSGEVYAGLLGSVVLRRGSAASYHGSGTQLEATMWASVKVDHTKELTPSYYAKCSPVFTLPRNMEQIHSHEEFSSQKFRRNGGN